LIAGGLLRKYRKSFLANISGAKRIRAIEGGSGGIPALAFSGKKSKGIEGEIAGPDAQHYKFKGMSRLRKHRKKFVAKKSGTNLFRSNRGGVGGAPSLAFRLLAHLPHQLRIRRFGALKI